MNEIEPVINSNALHWYINENIGNGRLFLRGLNDSGRIDEAYLIIGDLKYVIKDFLKAEISNLKINYWLEGFGIEYKTDLRYVINFTFDHIKNEKNLINIEL